MPDDKKRQRRKATTPDSRSTSRPPAKKSAPGSIPTSFPGEVRTSSSRRQEIGSSGRAASGSPVPPVPPLPTPKASITLSNVQNFRVQSLLGRYSDEDGEDWRRIHRELVGEFKDLKSQIKDGSALKKLYDELQNNEQLAPTARASDQVEIASEAPKERTPVPPTVRSTLPDNNDVGEEIRVGRPGSSIRAGNKPSVSESNRQSPAQPLQELSDSQFRRLQHLDSAYANNGHSKWTRIHANFVEENPEMARTSLEALRDMFEEAELYAEGTPPVAPRQQRQAENTALAGG